jgi:hypothetical protein
MDHPYWKEIELILTESGWTESMIENIDEVQFNDVIGAINEYLERKAVEWKPEYDEFLKENNEKYELCQAINMWAFQQFQEIYKETETMEHDWEYEEAVRKVNSIDAYRWLKIKEIMGEEDFNKMMSDS